MPKASRKRRHVPPQDVEFEIEAPRNKFKPFDEAAQQEEEQLSQILFGGTSTFLQSLEEAERETAVSSVDSGLGEDSSDNEKEPTAAWYDEEDDGIDVGHALQAQGRKLRSGGINNKKNKYASLLKQKYLSVVGTPSWAKINKKEDDEDQILRTVGFLKKPSEARQLGAGLLDFKKVKDLNCGTYSEGPFINAVEFHPSSRVALVAGQSGVATLYAVDAKNNNKLHSVMFQHFPILCAKFINGGNEAILGSRSNHIFSYDLMSAKPVRIPLPQGLTQCKKFTTSPDSQILAVAGKWGEIHLLTTNSKERICKLKQNSEVTAFGYDPEGSKLFSHSDSGEVTIFDMKMNRVIYRFMDEGCLQGTTISVSSSNQFLATGSAQGVVNLYNVDQVFQSRSPKPIKSIMNLTTSITDLRFNSTSEILGFSSVDIPNSVKMFHVGSGTVFSNFPGFQTKLGHINVVNFSPNGGFVALGNKQSTVSLFTLKHYNGY